MTNSNVKSLRPQINQEKLAEYIERRDKLLRENPHLQITQEKIDKALQSAGSVNNRLTTIQTLMLESFHEMKDALLDMQTSSDELQERSTCLKNKFFE